MMMVAADFAHFGMQMAFGANGTCSSCATSVTPHSAAHFFADRGSEGKIKFPRTCKILLALHALVQANYIHSVVCLCPFQFYMVPAPHLVAVLREVLRATLLEVPKNDINIERVRLSYKFI